MTQLHIVYNEGKGQMTINCEAFFPVSQNKLKQLLKVIDMDFEHQDDLLNQMMSFLKKAERDALDSKADLAKEYWKEHQKMCDLQHLMDDGRFPNGLPLKKHDRKKESERRPEGTEEGCEQSGTAGQKCRQESKEVEKQSGLHERSLWWFLGMKSSCLVLAWFLVKDSTLNR